MSDLVRYIAGNTLGRDHLTGFTMLKSESGLTDDEADRLYPVDITLAQAMAVAWRVKKWRLTGDVAIEETGTTPGPTVVHAAGSADIEADVTMQRDPDFADATREQEILSSAMGDPYNALSNFGMNSKSGESFSSWSTQRDGFDPVTGVRNTGDGGTQFGLACRGTLFNPDTQLFAPRFDGPGAIIGATPSGTEPLLASLTPDRNPETLLSGTGSGNLKFPGNLTVILHVAPDFNVPLQLTWRFVGQSVDTDFEGEGSADLTLEAIEFWPYKNTEGLPVYDTGSGAQLVSPFS